MIRPVNFMLVERELAPMKSPSAPHYALSAERLARFVKLVNMLDGATRSRDVILKKLKIDLRSLYRDLKTLRALGIAIECNAEKYSMTMTASQARNLLPLPNPALTIQEALQLAQGTTPAHRKLRAVLDRLLA